MTGPDDTPAPGPADTPIPGWTVGAGLGAGAVAAAADLLLSAGDWPARGLAAVGLGLAAGAAGWLAADGWVDSDRRRKAVAEVASATTGWAAPAVVPGPLGPAPTRPVPAGWAEGLRRQAWVRYAAAGAAAVAGMAAAFARLTPDRVAHADAVAVGFPAVVGALTAAGGAVATLLRVSGWESVFAAWSKRVKEQPATRTETQDGSSGDSGGPGRVVVPPPEEGQTVTGATDPPPPPPPPPEPPVWKPMVPPEPAND